MNKSDASQGQSASELISKRIAELGDWRPGKSKPREESEVLDRLLSVYNPVSH